MSSLFIESVNRVMNVRFSHTSVLMFEENRKLPVFECMTPFVMTFWLKEANGWAQTLST